MNRTRIPLNKQLLVQDSTNVFIYASRPEADREPQSSERTCDTLYLGGLFVGLLALLLLPPGGAGAQTLAQHCGQWSIVPSPSPGSMDILEGIAAISPQDVWTVGDYIGTQGFNQVLIERWNGKRWINVPSPNPGQKLPTRGRGRLFHRCLGGRRHQFSELGRPRHLD